MKTRLMVKNPLWALALVAALGMGVSACGGGGGSDAPRPAASSQKAPEAKTYAVALPGNVPAGHEAAAGTMTIEAGGHEDSNGVRFSCPAGGMDCTVTVAADGTASSTGGQATAALTPIAQALVASNQRADDAEDERDNLQGDKDRTDAEERDRMKREMAATAKKLHAGIVARVASSDLTAVGSVTSGGTPGTRDAGYDASDSNIVVSIESNDLVPLSEDKDATVAPLSGWTGKRYAHTVESGENEGDKYEAMVWSNIGEPTMGKKFGKETTETTAPDGYQYPLGTGGTLGVNTSTTTTYVDLIAGSNFDQSAGVKRFPLSDPNPNVETVVTVPGTFHGVPGTYSCTPATVVCAANVSGEGFQLGTVPSATDATFTDGGGTWSFKPGNPEARVTEMPDNDYASFGWWLHKNAAGDPVAASAFVDRHGAVEAASGLDALNGKATYMGSAAGKYALTSDTGGTNDAGHFTARATLEADFTNNQDATKGITGTIDQFKVGDAGDARDDWSVKLNGSAIGDAGGIGAGTNGTVWTIDGKDAEASGSWAGTLQENGDDGVPQVATGTFYTEYGTAGKMVGAFGATRQ